MQMQEMKSAGGLVKACSVSLALGALLPGARSEEILFQEQVKPLGQKPAEEKYYEWGGIKVRPSVAGGAYYDDNIFISRTNQASDLVWNFTPSVAAGLGNIRDLSGNFVSFSYTPNVVLFTDHGSQSTVDHFLNLLAQWQMNKLTLGLGQTVQDSTGTAADVGNRFSQKVYTTRLASRYTYSEKTSFGLDARQTISDYGALNSYNEWAVTGLADYRLSPKLTLGAGVVYQIRDIGNSENQESQQILLRAAYQVTGKLSLDASIGTELRQYQGGRSDDPSLVFSLGGAWQPRLGTNLRLEAFRRDQSSVVLGGQNYIATGFNAVVSQVFYSKYQLNLNGGYQNADYHATAVGAAATRNDDYYSAGVSVSSSLTEKWNVELYYLHRENVSSTQTSSFANNQVGLKTSYRF